VLTSFVVPNHRAGDVAFTKHSTALEVASDGSEPQAWSTKAKVGNMPGQTLPQFLLSRTFLASSTWHAFRNRSLPKGYRSSTVHTKPETWVSTPALPRRPCCQADLRLLCPAGGCAPVDQFESCNIARAPAYAVMAPAALRSGAVGQVVQVVVFPFYTWTS
jgi:hypothetical protein